jgi:hypothetical protein
MRLQVCLMLMRFIEDIHSINVMQNLKRMEFSSINGGDGGGDISSSTRTKASLSYLKGKGKVVPVLLLTEHHTMKAYWGVVV